jgi:oligoendopeptidase F
LWREANDGYYAGEIDIPDGYRMGWSYIPHFISTRFYTYAYVFAHLVTLALHAKYRDDPDGFVGPYLEFLSAGGSAAPAELLGALGLDLADPGVWDLGFAEIERTLELAETDA